MKYLLFLSPLFLLFFLTNCTKKNMPKYPATANVEHTDEYFGTKVSDPYRWLEDNNSEETANWVTEQNKVTNDYLDAIPFREELRERFSQLWNYERYSGPEKHGDYYIYYKNDGLQEQSIVYIQKGIDGDPEVFIDPNKLSDDGSVSLAGIYFSKDNKYVSHGISRGGSDWREFYVMNIETKEILADHIKWAKFTGNAWYKDGFFYSRYDEPKDGEALKASNEFQKLYYHKLGTNQSEDILVLENKQNSKRGFGAFVDENQEFLIINIWEGSATHNLLSYKNLKTNSPIRPLFDKPEAHYYYVGNIDGKFIIRTDFNAPNFKVVLVDPLKPQKSNWQIILPGSENVIDDVSYVNGKLIVSYLKDANTMVSVFTGEGEYLYDVELPGIGSASGFDGHTSDTHVFYSFESFTYPFTLYSYDIEANKSKLFKSPKLNFDLDKYETKQIFYESKDGTKVPLFIVHKKGLELNGENPALLYAYGGFNVSMLPYFSVRWLPILENDGIFALACLRGGGEYGEEWHKAGMLDKKQNVFDDYIAAAEYLIENKYTSTEYLAILGGSNGGTLVGAVMNQRPELFKVAFPLVGVMDMLRYHKFTIGWAWASEYGSSDNEDEFKFIYKYSPLHNLVKGTHYPATMVTTADHDDRVFPAHSFKYAAALQEMQGGNAPTLIRIETKVGHGAGTSTSKSIDFYTDLWAFMYYNMDLEMY